MKMQCIIINIFFLKRTVAIDPPQNTLCKLVKMMKFWTTSKAEREEVVRVTYNARRKFDV